ncbi:MAG: peptidoglycan-binding protein, partial [Acidisphaera sp.]|nr:peptidoglycan-binding protein [Acidisphaera sp.]
MLQSEQKLHASALRPWILVAVLLLLLIGAGLVGLRRAPQIVALLPGSGAPAPVAAPQAAAPTRPPAATDTPATAAEPAGPARPSFDVVRVDPKGQAVIAGRAEPGADVSVSAGGKAVGHATADAHGQWVLLPDKPLAPGAQELTLAERTPATQGGAVQTGDGSVLLMLPDRTKPAEPAAPVAVLEPPAAAAPRVLQAPPAATGAGQSPMNLDVVDYDEHGGVRFAGHAPPGQAVRVYVDNQPVGDALADAEGRWTLAPSADVAAGTHQLRVDQLDAGD